MEKGISALHDGIGLWREELTSASEWSRGRPALFLDRDGVIVESVSYLHKPGETSLIEGAAEIISSCNNNKIPVIIVTNQSGVGRGMYGWSEFQQVQDKLLSLLLEQGALIDMVLACAYHSDAEKPYKHHQHPWRKPSPGMIEEANKALQLDLSKSWIIGDQKTDIEAGRMAGLGGGILVLSGETDQLAANTVVGSEDYMVRKAYSVAACRFLIDYMS